MWSSSSTRRVIGRGSADIGPGHPLLELAGVTYTYPSASTAPVTAVHDVDLVIAAGENVAVVGPSGSGKSTLLGLMGMLLVPTAGQLAVRGESTQAWGDRALSTLRQRTVGFVFQQFHLLPHLDALANVELALLLRGMATGQRRARALDCLALVGLSDRASHHPRQLSGGEQQRVAIARAIAPEPPLLLADEPTGNLDSASRDEVMSLLTDLHAAGTTVVVVTHDPEVAERTQRRVDVRDGRVTALQ